MFMEHFEQTALKSAPFRPKLWIRYVDDTFIIWPHNRINLGLFLKHVNSVRDQIQFTMEKESEGQIAFVDVLVKT